jgi:hypothetical protein
LKRTPIRPGTKPIARRTRLKPGTKRLKRRTKLRQVNPERAAAQREADFGPQGEWMRELHCATCGAFPPSEPSHVRHSRGASGTRDDLAPQCHDCHEGVHQGARSFEREFGVDLAALAGEYAARWRALPAEERSRYERLFAERWPAAAQSVRGMPFSK